MPQLMEGLKAAFQQMGDIMQQQLAVSERSVALAEATLAAVKAPKENVIGNLMRDANGMISGATVKSTPMLN